MRRTLAALALFLILISVAHATEVNATLVVTQEEGGIFWVDVNADQNALQPAGGIFWSEVTATSTDQQGIGGIFWNEVTATSTALQQEGGLEDLNIQPITSELPEYASVYGDCNSDALHVVISATSVGYGALVQGSAGFVEEFVDSNYSRILQPGDTVTLEPGHKYVWISHDAQGHYCGTTAFTYPQDYQVQDLILDLYNDMNAWFNDPNRLANSGCDKVTISINPKGAVIVPYVDGQVLTNCYKAIRDGNIYYVDESAKIICGRYLDFSAKQAMRNYTWVLMDDNGFIRYVRPGPGSKFVVFVPYGEICQIGGAFTYKGGIFYAVYDIYGQMDSLASSVLELFDDVPDLPNPVIAFGSIQATDTVPLLRYSVIYKGIRQAFNPDYNQILISPVLISDAFTLWLADPKMLTVAKSEHHSHMVITKDLTIEQTGGPLWGTTYVAATCGDGHVAWNDIPSCTNPIKFVPADDNVIYADTPYYVADVNTTITNAFCAPYLIDGMPWCFFSTASGEDSATAVYGITTQSNMHIYFKNDNMITVQTSNIYPLYVYSAESVLGFARSQNGHIAIFDPITGQAYDTGLAVEDLGEVAGIPAATYGNRSLALIWLIGYLDESVGPHPTCEYNLSAALPSGQYMDYVDGSSQWELPSVTITAASDENHTRKLVLIKICGDQNEIIADYTFPTTGDEFTLDPIAFSYDDTNECNPHYIIRLEEIGDWGTYICDEAEFWTVPWSTENWGQFCDFWLEPVPAGEYIAPLDFNVTVEYGDLNAAEGNGYTPVIRLTYWGDNNDPVLTSDEISQALVKFQANVTPTAVVPGTAWDAVGRWILFTGLLDENGEFHVCTGYQQTITSVEGATPPAVIPPGSGTTNFWDLTENFGWVFYMMIVLMIVLVAPGMVLKGLILGGSALVGYGAGFIGAEHAVFLVLVAAILMAKESMGEAEDI